MSRSNRKETRELHLVVVVALAVMCACLMLPTSCRGEPMHRITIDGNFDDWAPVTRYTDPDDQPDGSVMQGGSPDCHDTKSPGYCQVATHVYNPTVNILEYAIAHDSENIYAYIRAKGNISYTSNTNDPSGTAGRSYIQARGSNVAIDADNYEPTGYCLNLGGYKPTSCGYDFHFELEMYNGSFNTAHLLLHAMTNDSQLAQAREQQKRGIVSLFGPATYKPYTEWVYWDYANPITPAEIAACSDGPFVLPNGAVICFVQDKVKTSPGGFRGIMNYAFSADWTSVEFSAPYRAFMNYSNGQPAFSLGKQMTIAVMLETSGEASTPVGEWSTDGAWPIRGYLFGSQTYEEEQAAAAATVAGRALVSLPLVISICLFTMSAIMLVVNIALAASRSSSLV